MTIPELLTSHENKMLNIKRRLYFLKAFEKTLAEMTRGKSFQIRNDVIYQLAYDTWDMLVIDVASLSKDMLGRGGFFNQLKANINQLKPSKADQFEAPRGRIQYLNEGPSLEEQARYEMEIGNEFVNLMVKHNREAFFSLFPGAESRNGNKVDPTDVDNLKRRFEEIVGDLIDDRNKHRAHKYERKEIDPNIQKLDITEIERRFDALEAMLNNIRLVADRSSLAYNNMSYSDAIGTSVDLVTLILLGSLKAIDDFTGINGGLIESDAVENLDKRFGWQYRDSFFDQMHVRHEKFYAAYCYDQAKKVNSAGSYDSLKIEDVYFNDPRIATVKFEWPDE